MGLFDERVAYKPFEYPQYYTEGWLKQAQAFWLHTEIPMSGDVKDWNEKLTESETILFFVKIKHLNFLVCQHLLFLHLNYFA